jgi:beta-phosphoglucomutase
MKTRAVFFDFDGTLIDSMPAHVMAWAEILGEIGIELEDTYFQMNEGEKAEDTISRLLGENGKSYTEEQTLALIEKKRKLYRTMAPKGLIPEARVMLDQLREKGVALDIVTGSIRSNIEAVLSDDEMSLFRNIVTPTEYKKGKPDPDPYVTALRLSELQMDECAVLENAPLGIRSARAAGLVTVAITTTLPPKFLSEATHIIHRFEDFLPLL